MREIKFRAWDSIDDGWVDKEWFASKGGDLLNGNCPKEVQLIQYTGLKDKNGKEIYEGDILKVYYRARIIDPVNHSASGRTEVTELIGEVVFEPGMVLVKNDSEDNGMQGHLVTWVSDNEVEVIGNIYENKDLLT